MPTPNEFKSLIGRSTRPPKGRERVPMNVHPDVRDRLVTLLFEPELQGVGYSEFIARACKCAEGEIVEQRRKAKP